MRYAFIQRHSPLYPVIRLCSVMQVSRSQYYAWRRCPAKVIDAQTLSLYRRARQLFEGSRESLGYRQLCSALNKEGFSIGTYKTRKLMQRLNLVVRQRIAYKITTKPKSTAYQTLLKRLDIKLCMGDVGACWDNVVVERFFGSLKHDWLLKVPQPTHEQMRQDVMQYMKYYNVERLHTANGGLSPIEFENPFLKMSGLC